MTQESTFCLNVPGEAVTEVSLAGLQAILGQVEAELYRSETYEKVLSGLRTLPEEMGSQVQRMVKAVSREAIRLAFRKLVIKRGGGAGRLTKASTFQQQFTDDAVMHQQHSGIAPSAVTPTLPSSAGLSQVAIEDLKLDGSASTTSAVLAKPIEASQPEAIAPRFAHSKLLRSTKRVSDKPSKRLSKKELAAQAAAQAWEDRLRELGQEIRQARQAKSWSFYHLHLKTQIPVHHLEAIEIGLIERLPEDVYIRSFVRQIGNALGLDGTSMAVSLPEIDPVKAILPTWHRPQLKAGLQLHSIHLYFGYAALMAGGLTWLSQQSAPQAPVKPSLIPEATLSPTPQTETPKSGSEMKTAGTTTSPTQKTGVSAPVGIAPPEMNPF